ncbi:putative Actin [Trypanosoma vivax]|nr:hypothetical protein TRVL_00208 [Trypanosoma vivax]KAH8613741.1 putative Actin [Trypanosoma vivax]
MSHPPSLCTAGLDSRQIAGCSDAWDVVLLHSSLATYLCSTGDVYASLEEKPVTKEMLALNSMAEMTPLGQRKLSFAISRLRKKLSERNSVIVLPVDSSQEYREKLVLFLFEKLCLRSIVVLSDAVAVTFATGLREALVVSVSISALTVSRVVAGTTVKYVQSSATDLFRLLMCAVNSVKRCQCGQADEDVLVGSKVVDAPTEATHHAASVCELGPLCSLELTSEEEASQNVRTPLNTVNLLESTYRGALVSLFGEQVYNSVAMSTRFRHTHTTVDTNPSDVDGCGVHNGHGLMEDTVNESEKCCILQQLIASVTEGDSLQVIVTGEALRVAPLLRIFLDEAVRFHGFGNAKKSLSVGSASSSSSSTPSSEGTSRTVSTSCFHKHSSPSLCIHPSPIEERPWDLPLLGGSLVGQLPLSELNRLRIFKEFAISTKGSIVHWRSAV